MIKCDKCNWQGQRYELEYTPKDEFGYPNVDSYLNFDNWRTCPNCRTTINAPLEIVRALNFAYNFSVLSISTDYPSSNIFDLHSTTYIHLSRILDFIVNPHQLNILGFKNYSNHIFNLSIKTNFEFESVILLKILHLAHLHKNKCEFKSAESYTLFGKWSKLRESMYPLSSCSFCARFYEWIQKQTNGWPLSAEKLQKMNLNNIKQLSGVPIHTNNKFAKIFAENEENKPSKYSICMCNEISPRPNPNCEVHKNTTKFSMARENC
jgi:hypothetical protein